MRRLKRRKFKAVLANLVCGLAWLSLCTLGSKLILSCLATVFILASGLFGALTIVSIKMKPEDYDNDTV